MDPIPLNRIHFFSTSVFAALLATSAPARADDESAPPAPPVDKPAPLPPVTDIQPAELPKHDETLEQRMQKLEDALELSKEDNAALEEKLNGLMPFTTRFSGYLDVGFFATDGNGAGTRSDLASSYFPEYAGIVPGSWVFMGDPLSTAVNSRGEPADTGDSRAIVFNPIHSRGAPSFIVNALNQGLFVGLGETATLNASVDFVPRGRDVSDPAGTFVGDFIDVKLAYAEWRPKIESFNLALQAGKFDSVIGYEYRSLESPDRIGITPSLICRYTCGRPLGLKARARFLDDALVLNVSVTNGSHFSEGFPFSNEIDTNQFKTVAGRLSYLIMKKLDLGVSGAFGAQDLQVDDNVYQWHVGADMHLEWKDLELTAELVHGRADGKTSIIGPHCDVAPCIHYTGAYGLLAYRVSNLLIPYARVDWRDALHESGASFVYISQLVRATVGLRTEIGTHVIVKAEGTVNRELGRIPQFPDDVFTTSLVIKY
ncbi:MAG: uncharacterized protein JWO36_2693 [Myxococcales bacterium]|nr:uncharacterized protein [Myxococcales bacterium]